jgi:hypothetical protein
VHRKLQLAFWEAGCVIFVAVAGSLLHFAFELSEFWTPLALVAAVNESAWEHSKIYFWPGVVYALVQYTYTRGVANNYWIGKALASTVTPVSIFAIYYSYMAVIGLLDTRASLQVMLSIMLIGITIGQFASYLVLSAAPLRRGLRRMALPLYAGLLVMYSSFTFFPPTFFLFENFFCYRYTGDYGILPDYTPYRVFARTGDPTPAGGVNYCASVGAGGKKD